MAYWIDRKKRMAFHFNKIEFDKDDPTSSVRLIFHWCLNDKNELCHIDRFVNTKDLTFNRPTDIRTFNPDYYEYGKNGTVQIIDYYENGKIDKICLGSISNHNRDMDCCQTNSPLTRAPTYM